MEQATPNAQRALWNGAAGRAWVEAQDLLDGMFAPFEGILLAAAGSARRVLDVGCGTGATTLALARAPQVEECVGIDISAPMIGVARERAAGTQANFICADAASHPFDASSFDLLVSRFGVMFFDDPVAAFANLRRAARPGASLCCIAWRAAHENPFMTAAERAAAPLLALPPRAPDGPGQFAFADANRVRAVLAAAGWRGTVPAPLDVTCSFPQAQLMRYAGLLGPVGVALQTADDSTREKVMECVAAAFAPFVTGDTVRFNAACWRIEATAS